MATAYPSQSDSDSGSDCDLPDPDAKVLSQKQEVFAQPHVEENINGIRYKKTVTTRYRHRSCWRSTDNNKIMLGGSNKDSITVLHDDGREYVYKKHYMGSISSCVSITDEKHLICIDYQIAVIVNITPDTQEGSTLHNVKTLIVIDPICIFAIDKLKYGILCMNPSRVEFFTLKDIMLDRYPFHSGVIKLDFPESSSYCTACSTRENTICVAAWGNGVIYQYNHEGVKLAVIGAKRGKHGIVRPGHLYYPVSIQRCGDKLLVSCKQGDVHSYQNGKWRLLMKNGNTGGFSELFRRQRKIRYSACSETTLWTIDGKDSSKVHVYDISNT